MIREEESKGLCINNGNNWPTYKYFVENYAMSIDADGLLNGSEFAPEIDDLDGEELVSAQARLDIFNKKSRKLCYYIRRTQSEITIPIIREIPLNDATLTWQALVNHFESQSRASIKQLLTRLVKLKQTGSCLQFVDELQIIRAQLEAALRVMEAKKISLLDLLCQMVLLDGVDGSFSDIVNILVVDDTLTFQHCRDRILITAERLRLGNDIDPSPIVAMKTSTAPTCSHCGKSGHLVNKCFKLHPHLRNAPRRGNSKATRGTAWKVSECSASVKKTAPADASVVTFEIDSDASHHFVNSMDGVTNFDPNHSMTVSLADGSTLQTKGAGSLGKLKLVHFAPTFESNLLSVFQLTKDGYGVHFHPDRSVQLVDSAGKSIVDGFLDGHTFKLNIRKGATSSAASVSTTLDSSTFIKLMHCRLGHIAAGRLLSTLQSNKSVRNARSLSLQMCRNVISTCPHCLRAKSKALPHRNLGKKSSSYPFEIIHVDVKGPFNVGFGNAKYALVIVDDFSRWQAAIPLPSKDATLQALKKFEGQVIRQSGNSLRFIRWDRGGENKNAAVDSWLTQIGAKAQYTSAHSSASNGIAERAIQSIMAVTKTIRLAAELPVSIWPVLMDTAVYINNRIPTKGNRGLSPYELLYKTPPDLSNLRTIGSSCFVHVHKPSRKAMDDQAVQGKIVGYASDSKCFKILLPTNTIVESAHVRVIEKFSTPFEDISWDNITLSPPAPTIDQPRSIEQPPDPDSDDESTFEAEGVSNISAPDPIKHLVVNHQEDLLEPELQEIVQEVIAPQRPVRDRRPPSHFGDFAFRATAKKTSRLSYSEAVRDPRLRESMRKEINHLIDSKAVEVVDLPAGRKPIGSVWAHKLKTDAEGNFTRAKSRICPLGYMQKPGMDYDVEETACPTVSINTVYLFLAIVVSRSMKEWLIDVDGAFTIPKLKEDIYMKVPDGMKKHDGKVLRLNHSLNGLKQSGYNWYKLASDFIISQKFRQSSYDSCLFFKRVNGHLLLIILYVDDFRLAADVEAEGEMKIFISALNNKFPCKTADPCNYLGMKIERDEERGEIRISQQTFINGIAERFNMERAKPKHTPLPPGLKLEKRTNNMSSVDFPYQELVGSLLWVARCSHPECLYAVNMLAQHMRNFGSEHVNAAKHVLQYLIGHNSDTTILHRQEKLILEAYCDADHQGEPEMSETPLRSRTGLIVYLRGIGPIHCQSQLQSTISKSTAESEYRACSTASQVISGYRNFLEELGFDQDEPVVLKCDNLACIESVKSPICSIKTRHIKADHHFIREQVALGEISIEYCPTAENVADILTKGLAHDRFVSLAQRLKSGL